MLIQTKYNVGNVIVVQTPWERVKQWIKPNNINTQTSCIIDGIYYTKATIYNIEIRVHSKEEYKILYWVEYIDKTDNRSLRHCLNADREDILDENVFVEKILYRG